MSGSDLRRIAVRLYGRRGWQKQLAAALGRDVSTVRRYAEAREVPRLVAIAVRSLEATQGAPKT